MALPPICSLFLLVLSAAAVTGRADRETALTALKAKAEAVNFSCSATLYPDECVGSLMSFRGLSDMASRKDVMEAALNVSIQAVHETDKKAKELKRLRLDKRNAGALHDCIELFSDTFDEIRDTMEDLTGLSVVDLHKRAPNLEILLSGAITNQFTCLEGFARCRGRFRRELRRGLVNITHHVSNSLAMVKNASAEAALLADGRAERRLSGFPRAEAGFPEWMSARDRRLLVAPLADLTPNAVVAKDGSGDFLTVSAAVSAAPVKSPSRYVIKIKAGVYRENVDLGKKMSNIMFVGDGADRTVITGSRSVRGGYTTFRSATVAVTGKGFLARDITFENTAGPAMHQAVALRAGSDLSAFYHCLFKGYQDTLYVHSLRQFYRECDIYGTVDFIFGNAAVVFQNCNLFARKPMAKQKITYTAQGRQDPNENTGISIHNCNIRASPELSASKGAFKAYLGRPWKKFSRTVLLESFLDNIIDPRGWLEWNGNFALSTLYYAEYMNRGPGAGTAGRVTWPGFHVINDVNVAREFTVSQFISGDSWLPATGVTYTAGLS